MGTSTQKRRKISLQDRQKINVKKLNSKFIDLIQKII